MRKFYSILMLMIALVLGSTSVLAQWGDCTNNVEACTNPTFTITPSGSGNDIDFTTASTVSNPQTNPNPLPGNSGCLQSGELNSTWLLITVSSSGTLEFSMGTAGTFNCYDWIMWPYDPNQTCTEIQNNNWAPIACNWNGACGGITGMANPANLPPGADQTDFEYEINVVAGEQYILCFSNFSSATTNVPLNFFGTANTTCGSTVGATICEGDTATIYVFDGTSYNWDSSVAGFISANATGDTAFVNPTVTTDYPVTINFADGTSLVDTARVEVNPAINPTYSVVLEQCIGDGNGSISVSTPGGTAPFQFNLTGDFTDNNTTGNFTNLASGNYIVEVIDDAGCSDTLHIQLNPGPLCCDIQLTTTDDHVNCWEDCSGMVTVDTTTAYPPVVFEWYDENMNLVATATDTLTGLCAGTYYIHVTDVVCTQIDTAYVTILPSLPTAFSSSDTTIVVDQTLELWTSGGVTYQWSPDDFLDCSDCDTVLCTPGESITYYIEVYDSIGCHVRDTINITVDYFDLFVPNGFSPNNDGVNDYFRVRGGGLANFSLRVIDKWGNMVFESFDIQTGWDGTYKGKELNTGVFLYIMEAQLRNGQEINKKGNVTLFR